MPDGRYLSSCASVFRLPDLSAGRVPGRNRGHRWSGPTEDLQAHAAPGVEDHAFVLQEPSLDEIPG